MALLRRLLSRTKMTPNRYTPFQRFPDPAGFSKVSACTKADSAAGHLQSEISGTNFLFLFFCFLFRRPNKRVGTRQCLRAGKRSHFLRALTPGVPVGAFCVSSSLSAAHSCRVRLAVTFGDCFKHDQQRSSAYPSPSFWRQWS